jgi:DNA (cytosine-5)-methyltransferase 1
VRFASVCSGIGAPELAWSGLGWSPVWCSEIEPFPSAVLAERFGTPNLGDMEAIEAEAVLDEHGPIDVLVGGTTCQSFSDAGLRRGLRDPRGNLARRFVELARDLGPRWVVWENVPGCLSSNKGRDFGAIVGALAELGYGWAYRVLDAQFFRVAQRRRRVFLVGCLGGWAGAAGVLLESSVLRGDPPPSREPGSSVAGTLAPGAHPGGVNGQDAYTNQLIPVDVYNGTITGDVAATITRATGDVNTSGPMVMAHGQGGAEIAEDRSPTLMCNHESPIVFDETQVTSRHNRSRCSPGDPSPALARGARPPAVAFEGRVALSGRGYAEDVSPALTATSDDGSSTRRCVAFHHRQDPIVGNGVGLPVDTDETGPFGVFDGWVVRRLMPVECERLQGFPDGWTLIDFKNKPASDAKRYAAIGNSMAVPVMRWIAERIGMVEAVREEVNRDE